MSINEVIKLGAELPPFWSTANFEPLWLGFSFVIFSVLLGFGIYHIKDMSHGTGFYLIFLSIAIPALILGVMSSENHAKNKAEYISNWKSETVPSFIEELPENKYMELIQFTEKNPLTDINVEDILLAKVTSTELLEGAEYGELKYIVDGKEKIERGWFIIDFIQDGEPYYSYKEVKKDLNETIVQGSYNKKLIVPLETYSFDGTAVIYFNK